MNNEISHFLHFGTQELAKHILFSIKNVSLIILAIMITFRKRLILKKKMVEQNQIIFKNDFLQGNNFSQLFFIAKVPYKRDPVH